MKKILALAVSLMMAASVSFAGTAPEKKVELGIGGGIALATSAGYDLGFGGQASGLFNAGENLGIGAGVGFRTFGVTGLSGSSTSEIELEALLKYKFGQGSAKPYLLVGAGLAISSVSFSFLGVTVSGSTSDPMVSGGLGVEFPAGESLNIFLQAQADIVIGNGGTFTYIPVDAGINFDI